MRKLVNWILYNIARKDLGQEVFRRRHAMARYNTMRVADCKWGDIGSHLGYLLWKMGYKIEFDVLGGTLDGPMVVRFFKKDGNPYFGRRDQVGFLTVGDGDSITIGDGGEICVFLSNNGGAFDNGFSVSLSDPDCFQLLEKALKNLAAGR